MYPSARMLVPGRPVNDPIFSNQSGIVIFSSAPGRPDLTEILSIHQQDFCCGCVLNPASGHSNAPLFRKGIVLHLGVRSLNLVGSCVEGYLVLFDGIDQPDFFCVGG